MTSGTQRNRQMQRQLINGPAFAAEPEPERPAPKTFSVFDIDEWPPVLPGAQQRPTWWQVHRVEQHPDGIRHVLICQARSEDYALRVSVCQRWRTVVTAGTGKLRQFENGKPPKVVA